MKKGSLLVLIVLLVVVQVHAQDMLHITPYKSEYAPAETVQVDILLDQSSVKDIGETNILLTQQGLKVAVAPFIEKITDWQYVAYFTLPLTIQEGSYELKVDKVNVLVDNVLQEISQTIPIVIAKQPPYLSISPGFIILGTQKEIKITVTNKGPQTSISLVTPSFLAHVYQEPQVMNQGTSRTFKFTVNGTVTPDQQIGVIYEKEYAIPIILPSLAPSMPPPQEEPVLSSNPFVFVAPTERLERTIDEKKVLKGTIALKNLRNETLQGVSLTLVGNLSSLVYVSPSGFDVQPFGQQNITITVNEKKQAPLEKYSGSLVATYQGFSLPYEMSFTITHAPSISITTNETITKPQQQDELEYFFNYTVQPTAKTLKRNYALWSLIIALALGILFSYLLKKQTVRKQTFGEYVKKIQKK